MSVTPDQSHKPPLPDLTNADVKLTELEKELIQNVHRQRGYKRVILEKEFKGGYSGTHVFLVSPVKSDGATDARVVTKIGPKSELREEKNKYEEFVKRALPFTAAQVWDYYEQGDWAALNYVFAGDGILGKTPSLEEYYQNHSAEEVKTTLDGLLGKALGPGWYGQNHPLNCLFREEYGQHLPAHEKLEEVVKVIFQNMSPAEGDRIKIPGVAETYLHPLKIYPSLLNQMLKGRKSLVHGDLHPRNVLVDESGKGWLIDFAKVTERHNLFDFIRLETYLRLMALAPESGAFSWNDYVQFDLALNADTLGRNATLPANSSLAKAYTVIQIIRRTARKYMGPEPDFRNEYFPALFLYCLAMLKYYLSHGAVPTQLIFITACSLTVDILEERKIIKPISDEDQNPSEDEQMPTKKKKAAHSGGNQKAGGDFVGRDKADNSITTGDISGTGIVIGHGSKVHINQASGASADEIARAFVEIMQAVNALPEGTKKEDAQDAVQKLEVEALKGEQAEESRVQRWFTFLAEASTDAWDVAVATLSNPMLGLGMAFKRIVQRAREERNRRGT